MLHVVSTRCLFHSVQIQSVEIRDLESSLWIFSQSIVVNPCQHGDAQEKAWAEKIRTSINSVFVTLWWKCFEWSGFWIDQNVWNKNLKLRAAISVFFYHDQNYELTILQIYVQESKNEREKSAERKEKFKICGVVVVCSIRVFCSTKGGCANTYWSVSAIKTIFEGDSVSIPFTKILIKLDALLRVPRQSLYWEAVVGNSIESMC